MPGKTTNRRTPGASAGARGLRRALVLFSWGGLAVAGLRGAPTVARAEAPRVPPGYAVQIDAKPVARGQRATATVRVTPGVGYHMNKDFPTSLSLETVAGVKLDKDKLGRGEATISEEKIEFRVAYTADAGKRQLTGALKFAICSATTCEPKQEKVTIAIEAR